MSARKDDPFWENGEGVRQFVCSFVGRTRGAIGIVYPIAGVKVEATDSDAARVQLADTHEVFHSLVIREDV